jgi:hypothetical protein
MVRERRLPAPLPLSRKEADAAPGPPSEAGPSRDVQASAPDLPEHGALHDHVCDTARASCYCIRAVLFQLRAADWR